MHAQQIFNACTNRLKFKSPPRGTHACASMAHIDSTTLQRRARPEVHTARALPARPIRCPTATQFGPPKGKNGVAASMLMCPPSSSKCLALCAPSLLGTGTHGRRQMLISAPKKGLPRKQRRRCTAAKKAVAASTHTEKSARPPKKKGGRREGWTARRAMGAEARAVSTHERAGSRQEGVAHKGAPRCGAQEGWPSRRRLMPGRNEGGRRANATEAGRHGRQCRQRADAGGLRNWGQRPDQGAKGRKKHGTRSPARDGR